MGNLIDILSAKNIKPSAVEIGEDRIEFSSNADLALAFDGFKTYAIGFLFTNGEIEDSQMTKEELHMEVFGKQLARNDEIGHKLRIKFITALSQNTNESGLKKIYKNVAKYMETEQGECNITYEAFVQQISPQVMTNYVASQSESLKKLRTLEELKKVVK